MKISQFGIQIIQGFQERMAPFYKDELAPDLSEFRVPVSRLIDPAPANSLSISEGERLWLGPDLGQYLVKTIPNPFALPPP